MSSADRAECILLIGEAVIAGARKFMACETLGLEIRTVERWEINLEDGRRGPRNPLAQGEEGDALCIQAQAMLGRKLPGLRLELATDESRAAPDKRLPQTIVSSLVAVRVGGS